MIFRDLFQLDDPSNHDLTIEHIIERGRTYNFEHLPKLLWVSTGERLPDIDSFERLRKARNAIQHFCTPENIDLRRLALEFLYRNIDPLIEKHFGLFAIEYHEDEFNDYVAGCLIEHELIFSIPKNFYAGEIDLKERLAKTNKKYQRELNKRLKAQGAKI